VGIGEGGGVCVSVCVCVRVRVCVLWWVVTAGPATLNTLRPGGAARRTSPQSSVMRSATSAAVSLKGRLRMNTCGGVWADMGSNHGQLGHGTLPLHAPANTQQHSRVPSNRKPRGTLKGGASGSALVDFSRGATGLAACPPNTVSAGALVVASGALGHSKTLQAGRAAQKDHTHRT
jgi:hypothetical protein